MNENGFVSTFKPLYMLRFVARIFDLLVVMLVFQIIQELFTKTQSSFLLQFLGYSLIYSLFGEQTLGKQLLSLKIISTNSEKLTVLKRISRELLFLLFLPFLILNVVFGSDRMIHDRICDTAIISDGIKKP